MKGSDTLVRLGQRWAEVYMRQNPDMVIQVSGGGSGTGIAALLNNTTDICMSSRDMKEQEHALAERKGIDVRRFSIALDGIAVFLHTDNPVDDLTLAEIKDIYTGKITNWKDLGGKDTRIILYGRENNSGTYAYVREHVLEEDDYSEMTQTLPGTASVVNAVTKDVNGIGYGGIAWATTVKHAGVQVNDTTEAVHPTIEAVSEGEYPISRELYFFANGAPNADMKAFINWCLSKEGQKVAEETDYVPLPRKKADEQMIK
jgi:phosphate transport system substrate-binding protein